MESKLLDEVIGHQAVSISQNGDRECTGDGRTDDRRRKLGQLQLGAPCFGLRGNNRSGVGAHLFLLGGRREMRACMDACRIDLSLASS